MNIYELILAGLRTKFSGVDEATLQRIASKKAEGVTDAEKVNSIVEGVTFADVLTNYGDFRANGASVTAKKNAIADYEKQHNLKDGKPVETQPQEKTPPPVQEPTNEDPKGLSAEEIAKLVAAGVAEAMKPFGERLDKMDAEKAKLAFDAKVDEVAKSFQIPSFAYKGKTIPQDADLNQYFTDLKQEMQNEGYQFASAPQKGGEKKEGEDGKEIAGLINQGTEEINKQK